MAAGTCGYSPGIPLYNQGNRCANRYSESPKMGRKRKTATPESNSKDDEKNDLGCSPTKKVKFQKNTGKKLITDTERKSPLSKKVKLQKDKAKATKSTDEATASSTKVDSVRNAGHGKGASRYQRLFFDVGCEDLSKELLGKKIVRELDDGTRLSGIIVETEAYLGGDDKAAHSYQGKKTPKNEAMFMEPGTIYVYHIYGLYTCINISARGEGAAVLIRGLDPTEGMNVMRTTRGAKRSDKGKGLKEKELGSGPSKLTQALQVDKAGFNKEDIVTSSTMWLDKGIDLDEGDIITSHRIGVDYAKEWAKKPLRFYIRGNKSVSVRDKEAEKQ